MEKTKKNPKGAGAKKKNHKPLNIYALPAELVDEIKSTFTPDGIRSIIIDAFKDELQNRYVVKHTEQIAILKKNK